MFDPSTYFTSIYKCILRVGTLPASPSSINCLMNINKQHVDVDVVQIIVIRFGSQQLMRFYSDGLADFSKQSPSYEESRGIIVFYCEAFEI